jgi:hypothetical protein
MKIVRLAGLALLVMAAVSLFAASAASASEPEFKTASGNFPVLILSRILLPLLSFGVLPYDIHCLTALFHGLILSRYLIGGGAFLHFLNCVWVGLGANAGQNCPANSVGQLPGLIIWNALHVLLGLILPSRAAGLLFSPVSGSAFVEVEESPICKYTAGKITGNEAGELTPTGKSQTTSKALFGKVDGHSPVTDIDLSGGLGLVKPKLFAFGETLEVNALANNITAEAVEVT